MKIVGVKDDNKLAEKVGSIRTHHYFNASSMFAGVIGELICQLPPQFKMPLCNDSYYIIQNGSVGFSEDGNTHCVTLDIYQRVPF